MLHLLNITKKNKTIHRFLSAISTSIFFVFDKETAMPSNQCFQLWFMKLLYCSLMKKLIEPNEDV